ncbi:hybrid sensor histidine kinase/response regulator [Rugamonas rubra]|uniref:histidine kinase n=1 Tax=Rugamonas rubra TaxID=758825 RepID=A0A1I4NDM7_9BURK|nr:hybrid sensor histidine kinase/response regulator [Rugamonas rubra]SFM13417.1 Signal transduction histidine kinase [Rugamonas rubra]
MSEISPALPDAPAPGAVATPPFEQAAMAALQAAHAGEVEQLRVLIGQLLVQVESLQAEKDSRSALEGHVDQLREANQHLVWATFGAQDLQAAAEGASLRQTEFLSMLAHELRNPLQPMAMANELLGRLTGAHAELPRLHAVLARQLKHMVRLVDDLLDASRIQSGKVTLQRGPVSLADVLDSAVETCQPMLAQRQQVLRRAGAPADAWLDGDAVRLAQVFSNLILNASKFSPEGSAIELQAGRLGGRLEVAVKDNGVGISAALQPFVFDLFTQGFRSLERAQGGLGIGLALVRTLVEMHGGAVRVRSEGIGLGSEFIVELPLAPAPAAVAAPVVAAAPPVAPLSILLVEDNVDASDTLSLLLTQAGHAVTQRFDGASGLAALQERRYDLVLCDIGLPGLDGFEVARRAIAAGAAPHFVATTGYSQPQDRARALAAGYEHYLIKPVDFAMLAELIAGYAR